MIQIFGIDRLIVCALMHFTFKKQKSESKAALRIRLALLQLSRKTELKCCKQLFSNSTRKFSQPSRKTLTLEKLLI